MCFGWLSSVSISDGSEEIERWLSSVRIFTYRFEDLEEGEYRVVFENDQPLTDKETEGVDSENNSKADQKVENGKIHGEISSIKLPSDEEIKAISEGKEPGADGSYDSETKTFERSNQNAGYIGYSRSLEGTAWLDINKNGLYEEETGDRILENVPVTLYRKNAEGEYEAVKGEDGENLTVNTDEDGHYKFEDLEPGTYKVVFEKTDLLLTKKSEESTDEQMTSLAEKSEEGGEIAEIYMPTDSEIAQENGFTADESGNYNDPHEDGGFKYEDYNRVITGKAWFDNGNEETNHDGSLDETDNVIPGITVILEKYNEETKEYEKVTETVTGEDGTYRFEDLEEGEYRVVFENDQPLTDKETEGVDSENNSKADQKVENGKIRGEISSIKLPSDEEIKAISEGKEPGADGSYDPETKTFERSNQNAGYIGYSRSLEGTAWLDSDRDGVYDESKGDSLLKDVPVTLYRQNEEGEYEAVKGEDGENLTVNTDENGHYKFEDLEPGTYKVVFEYSLELTKKSEESTDEQMTSLTIVSTITNADGTTTTIGGEIEGIYLPTDSEIASEQEKYPVDESGNYNVPHEDSGFIMPIPTVTPTNDPTVTPTVTPAKDPTVTPTVRPGNGGGNGGSGGYSGGKGGMSTGGIKTGDNTNIIGFVMILILAAAVICGIIFTKRRKKAE